MRTEGTSHEGLVPAEEPSLGPSDNGIHQSEGVCCRGTFVKCHHEQNRLEEGKTAAWKVT